MNLLVFCLLWLIILYVFFCPIPRMDLDCVFDLFVKLLLFDSINILVADLLEILLN